MLTRRRARLLAQNPTSPVAGERSLDSNPSLSPQVSPHPLPSINPTVPVQVPTQPVHTPPSFPMAHTVTHKVTTVAPAVTKFSGRKKENLRVTLRLFCHR